MSAVKRAMSAPNNRVGLCNNEEPRASARAAVRRPQHSLAALGRFAYASVVFAGVACCPWAPWPCDDPWANVAVTSEVEPNDDSASAGAVTFDASGRARILGTFPQTGDWIDDYALGPMHAGDRITIDIDTPGSELNTAVGVFDAAGNLFILNDNEAPDTHQVDPHVTGVIHHDSEAYYLVVSRVLAVGAPGGDYELRVTVERGGAVPSPHPQTVLLNFQGGTVTIPDAGSRSIDPFNAGDIHAMYEGQNDLVKEEIVNTVRRNFQRFNVEIVSTDDVPSGPAGPFSTVYFGGTYLESLGMALQGADGYNGNPGDDAVVFTHSIQPSLFTTAPDPQQLGLIIGNVASHEIGHLLGLSDVNSRDDVMEGYTVPNHLLLDKTFGKRLLDFALFSALESGFGQDADLLLGETVGRASTE